MTNTDVERLGRASRFDRLNAGRVAHLETFWGGHNDVVNMEGVVDFIGREVGLHR